MIMQMSVEIYTSYSIGFTSTVNTMRSSYKYVYIYVLYQFTISYMHRV